MSQIYRVKEDFSTVAALRQRAFSEADHIQKLIERNLDLLPSEDIGGTEPRRWLLIKNEMPVASPETGANQWSLDLLVGDQQAIPTLIECKLANNGESHREILGQLFEYAANGSYYWKTPTLLRMATATHGSVEDLRTKFDSLHTDYASIDEYFDAMVDNLAAGRLRLMFVLGRVNTTATPRRSEQSG
jgi:hypothetical protein